MKEEILLTILAAINCLGVAVFLFKVILNLIPKETKHAVASRRAFSVVYWLLFILLINIPITSYETYELVPFENEEYFQFNTEVEDFKSIEFKYKEGNTIKRGYIPVPIADYGYSFNEDLSVREVTIMNNKDVYQIIDNYDGEITALTIIETWSLLDLFTRVSDETWVIEIEGSAVQSVADFMGYDKDYYNSILKD